MAHPLLQMMELIAVALAEAGWESFPSFGERPHKRPIFSGFPAGKPTRSGPADRVQEQDAQNVSHCSLKGTGSYEMYTVD
jgi:hypothetical protein